MASKNPATIAYFTVVNDSRTGWTGGLLHLNASGRPLEFQCTLPVRPARTHEIMFGASLREHLIAEVIGGLLIKKSRTPIRLLCCDLPEAISIESHGDFAFGLLGAEDGDSPQPAIARGWEPVSLAGTRLLVAIDRVDEVKQLCAELSQLSDPLEPFDRIREAINEAQAQIARAQPSTLPSAA